jgi:hypothetical protein
MESFTQWDMVTYPGLMAAVIAVVGGLKKLFPTWIDGKEPHLGLALSYILGISTKLFIPMAFAKVNWIVFLVSLLFVAVGAKLGHDHFVNEIVKNNPVEKQIETKVNDKVEEKMAEIKKDE